MQCCVVLLYSKLSLSLSSLIGTHCSLSCTKHCLFICLCPPSSFHISLLHFCSCSLFFLLFFSISFFSPLVFILHFSINTFASIWIKISFQSLTFPILTNNQSLSNIPAPNLNTIHFLIQTLLYLPSSIHVTDLRMKAKRSSLPSSSSAICHIESQSLEQQGIRGGSEWPMNW